MALHEEGGKPGGLMKKKKNENLTAVNDFRCWVGEVLRIAMKVWCGYMF